MEFKSFPKIEKFGKVHMSITQKIHGTNAQIVVTQIPDDKYIIIPEPDILVETGGHLYRVDVGSRNRWIKVGDDNYGFAAFVEANKQEIVEKLGPGQHFGEWAGPGINSGEGLTEKTFFLFDWWKFQKERPLPKQMSMVPLLYTGPVDLNTIESVMNELKALGSRAVPGFMRPEGVVINLCGVRYKKVFEAEETQWKKADPKYQQDKVAKTQGPDLSHLLQPIRLEKLLSKDERLVLDYPESLNQIAQEYIKDLEEENQIGPDQEIKKHFNRFLYPFIKASMGENRF